jgi:hypothetical protein
MSIILLGRQSALQVVRHHSYATFTKKARRSTDLTAVANFAKVLRDQHLRSARKTVQLRLMRRIQMTVECVSRLGFLVDLATFRSEIVILVNRKAQYSINFVKIREMNNSYKMTGKLNFSHSSSPFKTSA